jgi:nitroreductase
MHNPTIAIIERRISATMFDATHALTDQEIEELTRLATLAPTAYNLQNWRFIAVRTSDAKAQLRRLAFGQPKVSEAAVTFIVCGTLPDSADIPVRLAASVDAGFMSASIVARWQEAVRDKYADPQIARDEAVRSATFGAATLIYAAEAMGLATGAMIGFDAGPVAREFQLGHNEVPVMLVVIGRAAPGNWPQKPRRPLGEVLAFA